MAKCKTLVELEELRLAPGDGIKIRWSRWDDAANNGEGGYVFSSLSLYRPEKESDQLAVLLHGEELAQIGIKRL